jgi:hypothetical protein
MAVSSYLGFEETMKTLRKGRRKGHHNGAFREVVLYAAVATADAVRRRAHAGLTGLPCARAATGPPRRRGPEKLKKRRQILGRPSQAQFQRHL